MASHNERYATLGLLILLGSIALTIAVCVYFLEPYQNTRGYNPLTCKVALALLNWTNIWCQCGAEVCNIEIPCLILKVDVFDANVTSKIAFPTYQAYKAAVSDNVDTSKECSKLYSGCDSTNSAGLFSAGQMPSTVPSYWFQGSEVTCHYRPNSPIFLDLIPTSTVIMSLMCAFGGIGIGLSLIITGAFVSNRTFYFYRQRISAKMSKSKGAFVL